MLFSYVALLSPTLLAVALPTDVWLVELGTKAARDVRRDEGRPAVWGELEADGQDVLDCAVASGGGGRHRECIKARSSSGSTAASSSSSSSLSPVPLLLSNLSFHRPRYTVSELRVLAAGQGWVEVMVVAGRAAHVYRIGGRGDAAASGECGAVRCAIM